MSAIQTEYKDYMPEGYEGAVANMRQRDFISRTCEDAGITKFGRAVAKGTTDRTVTTNLTGKTSIVGVTVLDRGARINADMTEEGFAQYDTARIAAKGSIWVKVNVAVVADEPAFVTAANPGVFTNVVGTNIRVGKFETSADAGGLAILHFDV